ncbi:MAG TPA: translation initiation factor [Bacteroidota bacterium]|nr:translation initiation factor [Bacteroidota bacterium]
MSQTKKLHSLSDLAQLLPESMKNRAPEHSKKSGHDGKGKTVRVILDTKGRNGKSVTLIEGLQHNPDTMEEIGRILKQHCGAGGTVKGGTIEIQGDQRVRAAEKLKQMNYIVK